MTDELQGLYNEETNFEKSYLFEQYKLYVDDAQKTSNRRSTTNNFFITVVTLLFGAITFLFDNDAKFALLLLDLIGISIVIGWIFQLNYYKKLNSAKFKVINTIEEKLPVNGFTVEWTLFKKSNRFQFTASRLELLLPSVIGILFAVFALYHIIS